MTQNESPFRIAVESPDACQRVIKVQVPRTEFDREYRDRLTEAVREHVRPGFRKGKTPRTTVEREIGDGCGWTPSRRWCPGPTVPRWWNTRSFR